MNLVHTSVHFVFYTLEKGTPSLEFHFTKYQIMAYTAKVSRKMKLVY